MKFNLEEEQKMIWVWIGNKSVKSNAGADAMNSSGLLV